MTVCSGQYQVCGYCEPATANQTRRGEGAPGAVGSEGQIPKEPTRQKVNDLNAGQGFLLRNLTKGQACK